MSPSLIRPTRVRSGSTTHAAPTPAEVIARRTSTTGVSLPTVAMSSQGRIASVTFISSRRPKAPLGW